MVTYTFFCLPNGMYETYRGAAYLGPIELAGKTKRERAASFLVGREFIVCRGPAHIIVVLTEEE